MWTGILFQDITTLLLDPKAFKDSIDLFVERYKGQNISVIAGRHRLCLMFVYFFSFLYLAVLFHVLAFKLMYSEN